MYLKSESKMVTTTNAELEQLQSEIAALTERKAFLEAKLTGLTPSYGQKTVPEPLSTSDFQTFLNLSPVPMMISAFPDGKILFVNKQLSRVTGLGNNEILGRSTKEFYTDPNDLKTANEALFLTGEILEKTVEFGIKGGKKFDTILASQKILFQGQDAILSAVTNNTDQANMYRALQENEARYRLLVENAPEAIILFDVENKKCIDSNRSASEMLGYSTSFLQQIRLDKLFPEYQTDNIPTKQLYSRYIRQALKGQIPIFEWQLLNRQQQRILCEVRLIAYELSGNKYIQCSLIDIGDKRKLESQAQRNQRLQVLGRLTGGIAHDFNNILAIILGHTELLKDKLSGTSEKTDRLLEKILKSSERGAVLTEKLLAYSRNQPLLPEVIQTNSKIRDISSILTSQIGHSISLDLKLGNDVWDCLADPTRLEGAILNLCLNARDSMPDGGTLTIETSNTDLDDEYVTAQLDLAAGEYVQISISDTGAGISQDNIDHVFDPFFTTQDFGQKSGLGLSMVFGFVKQSSGHISLYSELGHGTVARIYLPKYVDKPMQSAITSHSIPLEDRRTVLLVEDDPDIRLLALNLLQSMNYNVLEAKSGETALQLMKQNPRINLLLTDFVLEGGMNGEELALEARKISKGLPVLIMSGYTKEIMSAHMQSDDSTVILQKPFRKAELADKILEAKSRAHQAFDQM